ncbi:hypothetical protein CALCODRAFT_411864, partial [Calocera cornea HHB12733]
WDHNINHYVFEQLNNNIQKLQADARQRRATLNNEQQQAFEMVAASVQQGLGIFFLNGLAGMGKTHVYKTICSELCAEGQVVLCVASFGIAALLLPGGRTAHSMLKIPIKINGESVLGISAQSQQAELIHQTALVI